MGLYHSDTYNKWESEQERIKSLNNNEMKKKPYIEHVTIVSLWATGILFGGLLALTIIVSFITWNFEFYNALIAWLIEFAAFTRTVFVAFVGLILLISYLRRNEENSSSNRKNW